MSDVLAIVFLILFSFFGFKLKSLSKSGSFAAFIVGYFIYLGFEIKGLFLLGIFFITSSLWSKYKKERKTEMDQILKKGEERDYIQVFANGLLPAIFSLLYFFSPHFIWLYAFCFSISAANADTWASEIGSLSKKTPLHLSTMKHVPRGTSGAVSLLGLCATFFGALLIGICSVVIFDLKHTSILVITFSGVLGSLIDTIIGATIQVKYKCNVCSIETENNVHCHIETVKVKGSQYINNDTTNFLSILLATLFTATLLFIFPNIF